MPVFILQILADLAPCFVIADIARRTISGSRAKAAFSLAALCPFLANYASTALTETFEIFFTYGPSLRSNGPQHPESNFRR